MRTPTLGIEIELPWPTMLRRVDDEAAELLAASSGFWGLPSVEKARIQKGFDRLDAAYKDLVGAAFDEDIARGNDGFAEFALRPKKDPEELVVTTAKLYKTGVLQDGEDYPLHVTIGNVPLVQSSWLVLMCMEMSGGTTPERIVQTKTWDRKGQAGILARSPAELQLGSTVGFEMRSLALTGTEQLQDTLRIAQGMGELLVSKLAEDNQAQSRWRDVYKFMMDEVAAHGIDASYQWPNPQDDINPWADVSKALEYSEWSLQIKSTLHDMNVL